MSEWDDDAPGWEGSNGKPVEFLMEDGTVKRGEFDWEDTPCTEAEMRAEFGDAVTDLVMWLTDTSKPSDGNREARKRIDRAHTAAAPREAKTIKLADLIDNSHSIIARDPDFARTYLREKRLLLDEALRDGDPVLWAEADRIVRQAG